MERPINCVLGAMDVKREQLGDEDFTGFKWFLSCTSEIPKSHLDKADRPNTVDKIVQTYNQQSVEVVKKTLKKMDRKDLVEELSNISRGSHASQSFKSTTQLSTNHNQSRSCLYADYLVHLKRPRPSPSLHLSYKACSYLLITGGKMKRRHPACGVSLSDSSMAKRNASSRYKDIISKSTLISKPLSSPAVYQLRPKEEKNGNLTRKILGVKNPNKTNRTILLVGETGTGKSTLINSLVNYTMGVKFEDNIWFEIVEDEKRDQIESQTSDVITYEIFGYEGKTLPYSLTIIDTPGFGDTRGIELDAIVSEKLLFLFSSEDGVHEINAVGLVVKAGLNRVSDRLKYILDSVTSLFGKDMEKNIISLITHSDGMTPKNVLKALDAANIKCARNEKNQSVHFLFNNCQTEDRTGDTEDTEELKHADKKTTRGMRQFAEFLEKTTPQKLNKTVEVMNERIRLAACIENLKERVDLIKLKQGVIQQTKETLKKHEEEMKKNEKFTVQVEVVKREKKDISGGYWGLWFYDGAVTCNICEENCHYLSGGKRCCTVAWYPRDCKIMKKGRCTVCTKKCPVIDHVKKEWIHVNKTESVQATLQDMKKMYEQNKSESEKKKSLMEHLETEMEELTAVKTKLLDEFYQHVVKLEQIALNDNSLSIHVHLDFLIENMKETGDTENVKKLEEMKSRQGEGTVTDTVRFMFSKVAAAVGKALK